VCPEEKVGKWESNSEGSEFAACTLMSHLRFHAVYWADEVHYS